jgi:Spy/CpxP family protein refolding chaperone
MTMFKGTFIAALGGTAMLALSMSPASAFSLSSPSLASPASVQIDEICWHCGGGWHGGWHGGGWGGGWINQWGNRVCNW